MPPCHGENSGAIPRLETAFRRPYSHRLSERGLELRVLGFAGWTAALALIAACGSSGVTPTCATDATSADTTGSGDDCNPKAVCINDQNQISNNPSDCCKDASGNPLTGDALAACIAGFDASGTGGSR